MESQVHQTIGMIIPDGGIATTSILTNATTGGNPPSADKNLVIDHVYGYGMIASSIESASGSVLPQAPQSSSSPFVPSMRGRSKVWNEFSRTADGRKVTCHRCGDCLAYSNSHSTSSMLKHLKRKHDLDLYPLVNGNEQGGGGVMPTGHHPTDSKSQSSTFPASSATSNNPPAAENKRIRSNVAASATNNKSSKPVKRNIGKDADEINSSIQYGPLLFKDPCVRMKWTDHTDTFLRTFSSLYSDDSYTDVTLVAENHFFKAHRVILSSASEFFDESFRMTPSGHHPMIFLKDVKAIEFRILLDFIYKGEVSIPPSFIPGLVKIGSDLRVRGLSDFVWNEQLANSVFQAKPQQTPPSTTSAPENHQFTEQAQHQLSANQPAQFINSIPLSARITPVRTTATRTLIRQPVQQQQQLITTHPQQSSLLSQPTRLYSRVVNVHQTNATSGDGGNGNGGLASGRVLSSNELQGQIISGDLSTVCSSVATSFPSMKRIRIVTTGESRLSSSSQARQVIERTANKTGASGSNDGGTLLSSHNAASETTTQSPAHGTKLLVTTEGESLLSTSQDVATILSQQNNTINTITSIPLDYHQEIQGADMDVEQQKQLRPVITAVTSQAHLQGRNATQVELEKVVYSIVEIPDNDQATTGNGGNNEEHQILLHQDHEVGCDQNEPVAEPIDEKPFPHDDQ